MDSPIKEKKANLLLKHLNNYWKKEFYNKYVDEILKQYSMKLCSTKNEEKSSVVERWNRMTKQKM